MKKLTIAQMLEQAKNAGACSESIKEISKLLRNKKSVWKHPNAPYWCYHYAINVIKGRWTKAEEYIKKDAEWAYYYAYDVIKVRWLEAEEYIKKDAKWAYYYALYIIKGRWPEAEEYIKKNSEWAYLYARDMIKDKNERKKFLGE